MTLPAPSPIFSSSDFFCFVAICSVSFMGRPSSLVGTDFCADSAAAAACAPAASSASAGRTWSIPTAET